METILRRFAVEEVVPLAAATSVERSLAEELQRKGDFWEDSDDIVVYRLRATSNDVAVRALAPADDRLQPGIATELAPGSGHAMLQRLQAGNCAAPAQPR
jgi:hypothetical protein